MTAPVVPMNTAKIGSAIRPIRNCGAAIVRRVIVAWVGFAGNREVEALGCRSKVELWDAERLPLWGFRFQESRELAPFYECKQ